MSYKNTVTDSEKEAIIESALSTEEGRAALAASMRAPIRCGGMGYHNQVVYITHGGYPYPERALRAVEAAGGNASEFMREYRRINDDYGEKGYPQLMEPADHWDWVRNRDNPDHFPMYSLWDTKRAIRNWLEVEHLPCAYPATCTQPDLCDNCTKRLKARITLNKAAATPNEKV